LRRRDERRLDIAKRRIGHALQLCSRIDRRARQRDRRGEPPPRRGDQA
jgi:hypothetical protein